MHWWHTTGGMTNANSMKVYIDELAADATGPQSGDVSGIIEFTHEYINSGTYFEDSGCINQFSGFLSQAGTIVEEYDPSSTLTLNPPLNPVYQGSPGSCSLSSYFKIGPAVSCASGYTPVEVFNRLIANAKIIITYCKKN